MFTECYCTQFRRSANALTSIYDEALRPVGLKITQLTLLRGQFADKTAEQLELQASLTLQSMLQPSQPKAINLECQGGWLWCPRMSLLKFSPSDPTRALSSTLTAILASYF